MSYMLCLDCGQAHRCNGTDVLDALIERLKAYEGQEDAQVIQLRQGDDDDR